MAKFHISGYKLEQIMGLPYEARITDIMKVSLPREKTEFIIYFDSFNFDDEDEVTPVWDDLNIKRFVGFE